ncbi:MAG: site-specific integrase [Oscillospiraceae bacterium]|nr:site-specific integrase [Oscillospiraceae bacterium]
MEKYNIYHRQDGRWEGRLLKKKDEKGKRKYKYIFGKSKEEVIRKIDAIRKVKCSESGSYTVEKIFNEWYESISHKVKESTLSNYRIKASKHILPDFGDAYINSFNAQYIYSFIKIKQQNGLSNRYISDIVVMVKSIFKYASDNYNIYNPLSNISLPRKKISEIRLLEENETDKLKKYIFENQNRTTMGIALSLSTGLRIGELCALQWEDIDLKKRIMTVRKTIQRISCQHENKKTKIIITEPKSDTSNRTIPIPDFMIKFMEKFRGDKKEYILSGKNKAIEPRTLQYRFAKVLKNVNLPSIHFHALRHMFASNCIKAGFDVKALSEILGHSNVEITLNRYVHSSFEQKIKYMNMLEPIF